MRHLARLALAALAMIAAIPAAAQQPDSLLRKQKLAEARYLKSIYKTDQAIEVLSPLVSPNSFDEELLAELADCHFQNGDYDKAEGTYQMLSWQAPQNIFYRIKHMQLLYRLKAFTQSADEGKEVLAMDSIPAIASLTGDAFSMAGMNDSALVYYRRALELKPASAAVVSKAARVLLDSKRYPEVVGLTDQYLDLEPENHDILSIKGLAFYLDGLYDSSLVVFQNLEDMGEDSYAVHYYLGHSYWHTNVPYRAEKELLKAWAQDSSDANLAYTIAAVRSEFPYGFSESIEPWLKKAEAMVQPDSSLVSRIHQQYGLGNYREGHFETAIRHYQEAYRQNPGFIGALSTIGLCYERLKKYKQAIEYYEMYLRVAKPGTRGYENARKSIDYLKGELFMQE